MSKQEIKEKKSAAMNVNYPTIKDLGIVASDKDFSQSYAVWVRVLLQNWRQGTVGCKGRSDVKLSTKKPWKQKGTGRARAGSARSPLWRGGGVTFGPQKRTKTLSITKRAKIDVMRLLISKYVENKKVIVLDWQPQEDKPSTKSGRLALESAGIVNNKINLFLQRDDQSSWLSLRNIANLQVLSFDDVNAYDLSNSDYLVVLKKDYSTFKEMVAKWN